MIAAAAASRFAPAAAIELEEQTLGGVRVLRVSPAAPRATVLHFHGGGFRLGRPESSVGFATALAARCGVEVVVPAYRLAPEHPFPAGLADALAVATALGGAGGSDLIISGDSAGGGLAASLMRLTLARGMEPLGLVLLAPWLDMTVTAPSYVENAQHDLLFSLQSATEASALYLQGYSPLDPLASPLHGSVSDFPATLLIVSEHEVLRDDSVRFADALGAAGRDVNLLRIADMEHVAVTRDPALTGAAEAFEAVVGFVERIVSDANN
jgi:monoterpene epsilon-lactone hydrolase